MSSIKNITENSKNVTRLINDPLTLGEAYVNLGDKIVTKGCCNIALWIKGSLNDSSKINVAIKCRPSDISTDDYYPQIQSITSRAVTMSPELYEISDSLIAVVIPLGISQLAPYIQLEIKVATAGATPSVIDEAYVSFQRIK